jgi:non-specific serine/threonine protein kinase/serine/threonine-protein kinase
MEYVKGVPITEHCDRHKLTTRERLDLFMQVCEGVQHAHQKAIIHRDLKPSNVLVALREGKPEPKIIDFGVAKAIAQKLTERTMFTELGVLIGTPEYMSPEQAEMTGQEVDTRTDVYSLGVLLYELLSGALPFDSKELRSAGFDVIRRRLREEELPKPSTRLNSLGDKRSAESARLRRVDLPTLRRQLSGDLDWITMKAMEKDLGRRYGSPHELAIDIQRYLANEPVLASPPGKVYRARKFMRRHRVGVAVTAVGALVLLAFAVTMTIQTGRIAAERDRANREARASERVSTFLASLLGGTDPEGLGALLTHDLRERVEAAECERGVSQERVEQMLSSFEEAMRGVSATSAALRLIDEKILARAGEMIDRELAGEPLVAARIEHTIGQTYQELALFEQAEPHIRRAVEVRRRELGDDHPDTLRSMHDLATLHAIRGRYDEAERLYLETLETRRRVLDYDHPDTLDAMNDLGGLYELLGSVDEAERLTLEALEIRRRTLGDDHPDTLESMVRLAGLYSNEIVGRFDEAERWYLEVLQIQRRTLGNDHPGTVSSMLNLAALRGESAEPLLLEALEIRRRVLGDDHSDTLDSMNRLGWLYKNLGRYDEAEQLLLGVVHTRRRMLGDEHPGTLSSMVELAEFYGNPTPGRYDEAERLWSEVLEIQSRLRGEGSTDRLLTLHNFAWEYVEWGRYDEAEPLYVEGLEIARRVLGDEHWTTVAFIGNLGDLYTTQGRYAKAESLLAEGVAITRRMEVRNSRLGGMVIRQYGRWLTKQERYDDAEAALLEAFEIVTAPEGHEHRIETGTRVIVRLAELYEAWGKPETAAEWRAQLSAAEPDAPTAE